MKKKGEYKPKESDIKKMLFFLSKEDQAKLTKEEKK